MRVLVTGGLGYIGAHAVKMLHQNGYDVIVLDNLSNGHRDFHKWGELVEGDTRDEKLLDDILKEKKIAAIMHFAAFALVSESVENPNLYYENNVCGTLSLVKSAIRNGVDKFIFSSTCAVYGTPEEVPVSENHPKNPVSPYGRTKLAVEWILEDASNAYDFRYVSLRYFNAAGADPDAEIGEDHSPETHLIPLALDTALGRRKHLYIYGTDYNTPDGTAIRDYIHVLDLADAHIKALEYLNDGGRSDVFNLGIGKGYSVKEVVETVKKITGVDFKVIETDRRKGDAEKIFANPEKAMKTLNWKPKYDLEYIVKTAWNWHRKRFGGGK